MEKKNPALKLLPEGAIDLFDRKKVYFSYSPSDKEYVQKVYELIAAEMPDIAFLYIDIEEKEQPSLEDVLAIIDSCSLVIVPVTSAFLHEDSRARNEEIPHAIKHQIPVLPLVYEKGLEVEFNEKMGNLHCFFPNEDIIGAFSFEEKLRQYLSNLFHRDTLNGLDNCFKGKIFLSYRRDDRPLARKLIATLHQNERFQSYAIWYDEFLQAGEKFDDVIKKNILSSDLFMLLVTPTLLENENNYVRRVEYPLSKGKGVVAVEVIKTQSEMLENWYKGIPKRVDAKKLDEIGDDIEKALPKKHVEQEVIADQKYLLSKAYHYGIKVEKNIKVALTLLEIASQGGNLSALEDMSNMYLYGDGVTPDLDKAIAYRMAHLDKLKKKSYDSTYGIALDHLWMARAYSLFKKDDKAKEELLLAADCFEKCSDEDMVFQSVECFRELYALTGQSFYLLKALETLDRLDKKTINSGFNVDQVARLYLEAFRLYRNREGQGGAREKYEKALLDLVLSPDFIYHSLRFAALSEIANSGLLGYEESKALLDHIIGEARGLIQKTNQYLSYYANALASKARLVHEYGDYKEAISLYEEACKAIEPSLTRDLSSYANFLLSNYSNLLKARVLAGSNKEEYEKSLQKLLELIEIGFKGNSGKLVEALRILKDDMLVLEGRIDSKMEMDTLFAVISTMVDLEEKEPSKLFESYEYNALLTRLLNLAEDAPIERDAYLLERRIEKALEEKASKQKDESNEDRELELAKENLEYAKRQYEQNGIRSIELLLEAIRNLRSLDQSKGRLVEAEKLYQDEIKLLEKHQGEVSDWENRLSTTLYRLLSFYTSTLINVDKAKEMYEKVKRLIANKDYASSYLSQAAYQLLTLSQKGFFEVAEEYLDDYLSYTDENRRKQQAAYHYQIRLLARKYEKAEKDLLDALRASTDRYDKEHNLKRLYCLYERAGQLERANEVALFCYAIYKEIEVPSTLLELDPILVDKQLPDSFSKAVELFEKGNYEEAKKYVLSLNPQNEEEKLETACFLTRFARLEENEENVEMAKKAFEEIIFDIEKGKVKEDLFAYAALSLAYDFYYYFELSGLTRIEDLQMTVLSKKDSLYYLKSSLQGNDDTPFESISEKSEKALLKALKKEAKKKGGLYQTLYQAIARK